MQLTAMPMPGALRLRALHPLIDGDGSCSLIYDLERAAVVEIPEELQFHIAPALEMGNLDEDLVGWLTSEDLLTSEGWAGWREEPEAVTTLEAGWWSLGSFYRLDDTIHARIDQPDEETVLPALDLVFKQALGTGNVKLHLDWGGVFPGRSLLEAIVVQSKRRAGLAWQSLSFELSLDASEVTPEIAGFLAGLPVHVRLLCGSHPGPGEVWPAEPAIRLLVRRLADRLTVCCVLDRARLLDLWEWAKRSGVQHLDAVRLEDSALDGVPHPSRVRELRNDLLAVCDEMAGELATQRLPVDYKPLTRIVGRLRRSEPLDFPGEPFGFSPPGLGLTTDLSCPSLLEGFDSRMMSGLLLDFPAEEMEPALVQEETFPCRGCWARHICNHSSFVASSLDGEDSREPSEERCSLWRTEVEVALRFYHRLAHTDPIQVLRFFEEPSREPITPPIGRREDLGHLKAPF